MAKSNSTRLYRSETDRFIAGVCGGIAEYFHIDATLIRLLFIVSILLGGSGLFIYLILWLIIPTASAQNQSIMEATMQKIDTKTNSSTPSKKGKSVWGLFLVGLGLLMLLDNFGIGRYLLLEKTWPSIFIILGLIVLSR